MPVRTWWEQGEEKGADLRSFFLGRASSDRNSDDDRRDAARPPRLPAPFLPLLLLGCARSSSSSSSSNGNA